MPGILDQFPNSMSINSADGKPMANFGLASGAVPSTVVQASPYSGTTSTAITTIATTAIKASSGVIGSLVNASNAVTGLITVYDSLSAAGKLIWSGTLAAGQALPLGVPCSIGITIVTAGAQAIVATWA